MYILYYTILNATISLTSVLQITEERTESLVEGDMYTVLNILTKHSPRSSQIQVDYKVQ